MSVILPDQYEEGTNVRLLHHVADGFEEGSIVIYINSFKRSSGVVWHNFINYSGVKCVLLDGEFEVIELGKEDEHDS